MSAQTALDPSKQLDIYLRVERDNSVTFNFVDEDGVAKIISSHTFQAVFTDTLGNGVFTLTESDGLTKNPSSLVMDLDSDRSDIEPGEYYWQLIPTDLDKTWLNGKAFFHRGIFDGLTNDSSEVTIVEDGDSITIQITQGGGLSTVAFCFACSDETTGISAGTGKITVRLPFAMTVTAVYGELTTAQASGSIFTVDINNNGTSILSTKLTIDNTETDSYTAATPPVISSPILAFRDRITVDVDQIGDGTAKGLKINLIGDTL